MSYLKKLFSRRGFIKRLILSLVSIELVYLFVNLLRKGNDPKEDEKLFEAGDVSLFQKNKVYPFTKGKFYLSRIEDGGFLAISTKCTHLGCTVQFYNKDDKFLCPCHASAFNKYGEVLAPPATRALDLYPIKIINGKVMVNIAKAERRNKYKASQLTYA